MSFTPKPAPDDGRQSVVFSLDKKSVARCKKMAEDAGIPMSELLRQMVHHCLREADLPL